MCSNPRIDLCGLNIMTFLQTTPSSGVMLRLCINVSRNPNNQLAAAAGRRLLVIRNLASSSLTDTRGPASSSSSLPLSAAPSTSSFGLSLESLEAYASRLAARNKHPNRAPIKRKSSRRPPPPTEEPKSFDSLGISPLVQSRLQLLKLTIPTDVQSTAIPVLLRGDDAAIQSYTGSGKTLAYLLPILSRVGPLREPSADDSDARPTSKRGIEAVVVAPSRELAMQIVREAERILGTEHKKVVQQLVGGANRTRQDEAMKKNKPLIVVGTPGRLSEISRDGKLHTHTCRFLILDEADELLSIQFREDMRRILEHVGRRKSAAALQNRIGHDSSRASSSPGTRPSKEEVIASEDADISTPAGQVGNHEMETFSDNVKEARKDVPRVERQTVLVSATMPTAVLRAAAEWGQKPLLVKGKTIIDVESAPPSDVLQQPAVQDVKGVMESMPPSLQHFFAVSQLQHRVDTARKCIHAVDAKSVIVFMNHPRRLKDAVFKLEARGITAAALHGELGKLERTNTLAAFRNGKIRVLVTSEVGARGIDVPECDLVVNLELPTDMTHYAHRAGRTGRLGRKGTVVSICEENEAFVLRKFQRQLNVLIEECEFVKGGLVSSKESASSTTPELVKA